MTAAELAQCWVPVPLRWRHVRPGDVIVGRDVELWSITNVGARDAAWAVVAVREDNVYGTEVDPDETVDVLVPVPERDGAELIISELGAQLATRREAE